MRMVASGERLRLGSACDYHHGLQQIGVSAAFGRKCYPITGAANMSQATRIADYISWRAEGHWLRYSIRTRRSTLLGLGGRIPRR